MINISNCEKQANDFLLKYGMTFQAKFISNEAPRWNNIVHGHKYKITLKRANKSISFDFWNSFNDSKAGKSPTAYDVLACCSSDINIPDNFEDFCSELGYEPDSIKALKTFEACKKQSIKLNNFFNSEEIVDLQEIN